MIYDLYVVADPGLQEEDFKKKLTQILDKEEFSVADYEFWGKKPLSYPIKKQTDGVYAVFGVEGAQVAKLYARFKLEDSILRSLILRREKDKISKITKTKGKEKTVKGV